MEDDSNFIPLAALVANVLRWLELSEKHQEDRERNAARQGADEDHTKAECGEINQPLNKRPAT